MKLNIHRVVMVQSPAIVNWSLSEHRDGKLLLEGVVKEALDFPRVAEVPAAGACVTRKRRGAHEALLGETKVLRDLLVRFCFHEHGCDLLVSAGHRAISFSDLLLSNCQRVLVLFDLRLWDQSFGEQLFRSLELIFSLFHVALVIRQ